MIHQWRFIAKTLFSQWMTGKGKQSCCCACSLSSFDAALALGYCVQLLPHLQTVLP